MLLLACVSKLWVEPYDQPRTFIRALNLTVLLGVRFHSSSGASTFIKHAHTKNVPLGSRCIQCRNSVCIIAQRYCLDFPSKLSVCSRNDGCTVITVLNVAKNSCSTVPSSMSEYIRYNNYTVTASSHHHHIVSKGDRLFKSKFSTYFPLNSQQAAFIHLLDVI